MTTMPNNSVLYSCTGKIATLTLNRPEVRNALNPEMLATFEQHVQALHQNPEIRVVLIKGAGSGFMAGGDIHWFHETRRYGPNPVPFAELLAQVNSVTRLIRTLPIPVIAAVQGACAGYGVALMLAADIAVAAETARFSFAYPRIGQTPDGASTWALVRAMGLRRAMSFALLDETLDAPTALTLNLVNRVVSDAELNETVLAMAEKLANGPALAYARTKQLMQLASEYQMGTALEAEAEEFAQLSNSADFLEGVSAFLEKRTPRFTGS